MTPLFNKLNFKAQPSVVLIQVPETFANEKEAMSEFTTFLDAFPPDKSATFVLSFATTLAELDAIALEFSEKTVGDVILWVAFPKGTSKRYKCTFNRDTGWDTFGALGLEPNRSVSIDEDWTALRFRRVEFIKTMTRSFALTEEGKERAKPKANPLAVPDDLQALLHVNPAAATKFEKLAPSHRKEYIRWIEEAKKEETRLRRLQQTIERLLA